MIGFGQNVNIPDANFKAYLVLEPLINTNGDTEIQVSEAAAFNGYINLDSKNISDLTGIEAFTALTEFDCQNNQLTTLDVSQNTALTFFACDNNQLTTLDVSANLALTYLNCNTNQLTFLDITQNIALTYLRCNDNQLTSLDVTQNTFLNNLFCANNQITYLDLTSQISFVHLYIEGNNLTSLDISHMQCPGLAEANLSNPNLFCIQVTDASCWYQPFTSWMIDTTFQYFSANCSGTSAIAENSTNKELLKVTDLLGRETKGTKNEVLFYIYDDGTVEKRIVIE